MKPKPKPASASYPCLKCTRFSFSILVYSLKIIYHFAPVIALTRKVESFSPRVNIGEREKGHLRDFVLMGRPSQLSQRRCQTVKEGKCSEMDTWYRMHFLRAMQSIMTRHAFTQLLMDLGSIRSKFQDVQEMSLTFADKRNFPQIFQMNGNL